MDKTQLSQAIYGLLEEFVAEQAREHQAALDRIQSLESDLEQLRRQLAAPKDISEQLRDDELRRRLLAVANAPFDTRMREAGVVLENRIRKLISPAGAGETGSKLVDLAFAPGSGQFQVSTVVGEQTGLLSLYTGAIQFIRNPPMHKLIEYPEQTAYTLLTMIDSLLVLLTEVTTQKAPEKQASGAQVTRWNPEMLRNAYRSLENGIVRSRLEKILEWSLRERVFCHSHGAYPVFGINSKHGKRMISFYTDGGMYFSLMLSKFSNEAERDRIFNTYQEFRFLDSYVVLADVKEGRFSVRSLVDLTEDEFEHFMTFLAVEISAVPASRLNSDALRLGGGDSRAVTSPRLATNGYPKDRDSIIEIFKRHGYPQFSNDQSVVRVKGKGRFGEYVAVHPEKGSYTLYVRRGGAEYLLEVAEDLGGSLDGPVLAFRSLDMAGIDRMVGRLVASLKNHPV